MKTISTFAALMAWTVLAGERGGGGGTWCDSRFQVSGFALALDDFSRTANSDEFMKQLPGVAQNDSKFLAVFKPIVAKQFGGDLMKKAVETRLRARCKPAQMSEALARLRTPSIGRMLALEAEATTPAGKDKIRKYAQIYQIAPPPEDRLDAVSALDQSSGLTDFTVDSIIAVMRGMLSGSIGDSELAEQLQDYRTSMRTQVQTGVQLSLLATYHGVTKADLRQYARELNSEPLKTVYAQMKQSMLEVFEERARAAGEDLRVQTAPKSD